MTRPAKDPSQISARNLIESLRESLRDDRAALEQNFIQHGKAAQLLNAHSRLVDQYLRRVWRELALPGTIALVAVGGYGRGELYPKSDIDLLILLDAEPDMKLQEKLHQLVGALWDIGLEVGHSIRTVAECLTESVDITVQTNLLEARLLTGNAGLYQELQRNLHQHLNPRDFFLAKQNEQLQRHARFVDSDYNLEPNLKESPGGLRDLQTITWISRAAGLGTSWTALTQAGLISHAEACQIAGHNRLLQTLRIRLHYLAKRGEDRLLFDFQTPLAEQMNISASANRRASEHLMQHYYHSKLAVRQFNTILLQHLQRYLFPEEPPRQALNERFMAVGTLLEARSENLFEHAPEAIFELFLLMQQHPELTDLGANTLRALWRAQPYINAAFRRSPLNRERFMTILRQPHGVIHALRRMNQYGVLGRYIPAFGRIVGQMQHDLFHVYTVDEHILMVVRNLRRFALPEHAHAFPLCSKLFSEFARPEVLYVAGLFHDIAKGRGGDHSQLGKQDAKVFCAQHKFSSDDSDLVVWLVEQHLTLSATAQKQDLSNPEVISAFAGKMKNDRYLVALYLLTVADVRGTSPKVWNAWKAKLMADLFLATRRHMKDGDSTDRLSEIRLASAHTLNLYGIAADSYQLFWAQLDDNYFFDHEAREIAQHTRILLSRVNTPTPIVKARFSPVGEGFQILVYSRDRRGLFAQICDFFARMHYTIVDAKIHTTQHGYALNSFQIMQTTPGNTTYRDLMTYIEFELGRQIAQQISIKNVATGRVNRQLKHFPLDTKVDIRPSGKGMYMLSIVIGDQPGLLARIALTLDQHNIRLHRAKINTMGSRAENVFWVTSEALALTENSDALLAALLKDEY